MIFCSCRYGSFWASFFRLPANRLVYIVIPCMEPRRYQSGSASRAASSAFSSALRAAKAAAISASSVFSAARSLYSSMNSHSSSSCGGSGGSPILPSRFLPDHSRRYCTTPAHRCPLSLEGDALGFQRRIQHSREHPLTIVDKQLRTILVQDQAQCQLARWGTALIWRVWEHHGGCRRGCGPNASSPRPDHSGSH